MRSATHLLAVVGALSSLSAAQDPPAPTTSLRPLFIFDSHPQALDASVVSIDSQTTTYRVACPTAASPENDACRAENYYPADVVHAEGSIFAGTNTATASVTKIWFCRLGHGSSDTIPNQYGRCNQTTVSPGPTTILAAETAVNECFVLARSVPVIITAGMDKVYSVHPGYRSYIPTENASYLASAWTSLLSESSCPLFTPSAPTPMPSGSGSTSTTPGGTGGTGGSPGPAQTGAPKESNPPSGSSHLVRNLPMAVGSVLLGVCLLL